MASVGDVRKATLASQSNVGKDEDALDIPQGVVPRVLPLLCHDILESDNARRRLDLLAFLDHFPSLTLVSITQEDAVQALATFFHLIYRPLSTPPSTSLRQPARAAAEAQQRQHEEVADLAFRVLTRIFTCAEPQYVEVHLPTFINAMQILLRGLKCTMNDFYKRPTTVSTGQKQSLAARISALKSEVRVSDANMRAAAAQQSTTSIKSSASQQLDGSVQTPTQQSTVDKEREQDLEFIRHVEERKAFLAEIEPFRRYLAEATFLQLKNGFDDLDTEGSGELCLDDFLHAGQVVGGFKFDVAMFKAARRRRQHSITFREFMAALFPALPADLIELFIEKAGVRATILQSGDDGLDPKTPDVNLQQNQSFPIKPSPAQPQITQTPNNAVHVPPPTTLTEEERYEFGSGVNRAELCPSHLILTKYLERDDTRWWCIKLLQALDLSGILVMWFCDVPKLHLYVPHLFTSGAKVYRDFMTCSRRPRQAKLELSEGAAQQCLHIKTNIPKQSGIMWRILVEGYNYGVNASIHSEIVGFAHPKWVTLDDFVQHGFPADWGNERAVDHASGARIGQYYSSDGFVVVRLIASSLFNVGFSVSGWLCSHGHGGGWPLTAEVHHDKEDL